MDGIIVIDKPAGPTSFGIVARVRRALGEKKVGHMGTLDPEATGVLPITLGAAARVLDLMPECDKQYVARLKFGIRTDTQDVWGNVISHCEEKPSVENAEKVLEAFRGKISQIPPMYSAIKKNGVRLYEIARSGGEIERESRVVNVKSLDMTDFNESLGEMEIRVRCSQGTYVRTLCSDIGDFLGCGAVMTYLRRTESNGFGLKDCVCIEDLERTPGDFKTGERIFPTDYVLRAFQKVDVTYPQARRFQNGGALSVSRLINLDNLDEGAPYRVYYGSFFIGVGSIDSKKEELSVVKVFGRVPTEEARI